MKGYELERSTMVWIALTLIVLVILIGAVAYWVLGYEQPQLSREGYIRMLCPEWVVEGCDMDKAANDPSFSLEIEGGQTKFLSELCVEHFSATKWNDNTWEACKEMCVGCP